ncbi:aminotransferase class IV [Neobacillus sp. PS3-12]|uniref:aminotransferase class IV n=1 Tax=Neobacillus sp. PS3-12 TaxID=3070677 RepID=UPI0027DFF605|nr:aminotransferase class IV [Neobacillus sp. PS3-12]WML55827.1 aminotransferase class IV [Neobacillus sp. PS3-12]
MLLTSSFPDFELLESLRLENGGYDLLDRHLQRLQKSAAYFGIPISEPDIRKKLTRYAQNHPNRLEKVRLVVNKEGQVLIEGGPVTPVKDVQPICLAKTPISKENRFLYHKTTYREVYEHHRPQDCDFFDVLLWNEAGELTEFTIGNLVVEIDGKLFTPPVACGLLAGTMREELLAKGKISERNLRKEDLNQASGLWLINSVRGWVPVYLK